MLIKQGTRIPSSQITDESVFSQRRQLLKSMGLLGAGMLAGFNPVKAALANQSDKQQLTPTTLRAVENYNNYYEFSFKKEEVSSLANGLIINPWAVEICGEVERCIRLDINELVSRFKAHERVYRFRCVEGWAMVVPWLGIPLAEIIKFAQPLSSAKYVRFVSVTQPEVMENVKNQRMLDWPYQEGLRIDEAMHPLTLLATGMYGKSLTKQNGAPLRLIVPWKYGFKSIKAIVKIELVKYPPVTTWNKFAPQEYGFYANVNPNVSHPRWSQGSERLLGYDLFSPRRETELFNGYADEVASLYSTMNLRQNF